mgnify:CR=1 FL=1
MNGRFLCLHANVRGSVPVFLRLLALFNIIITSFKSSTTIREDNMAYIVAMLSRYAGGPENVRKLRVRFLGNVLGGDRLTARGVISNVREENGATVADVDVWLERSAEDVVLKGAATITVG